MEDGTVNERLDKLENDFQKLMGLFDQVLDAVKGRNESIDAALAQMRQLIQEAKNNFTMKPPTGGRTHNA